MATFRIVSERSRLLAEARSSLHPIRGDFAGVVGDIEVETAQGRLDLRVPPKARVELDVGSLKTGNMLYDRELERRLEVRKYPQVRAVVLEVKTLGAAGRYHVRGSLAFHGRTQSVEGEVSVRILDDGATLEVEGEKTLDMRDFGLEPPEILMLRVYPEVRVWGRIVAQRAG